MCVAAHLPTDDDHSIVENKKTKLFYKLSVRSHLTSKRLAVLY